MPIGLDTNLIVYAITFQDEEKQRIAEEILREALEEPQKYAASVQVLAETVSVISRKAPALLPEALRLVKLISKILSILYYTPTEIEQASNGPPREFWDRLLAYTYKNNGVEEIITEDEKPYEGLINTVNPFRAAPGL